jgi:hypothetical protein
MHYVVHYGSWKLLYVLRTRGDIQWVRLFNVLMSPHRVWCYESDPSSVSIKQSRHRRTERQQTEMLCIDSPTTVAKNVAVRQRTRASTPLIRTATRLVFPVGLTWPARRWAGLTWSGRARMAGTDPTYWPGPAQTSRRETSTEHRTLGRHHLGRPGQRGGRQGHA